MGAVGMAIQRHLAEPSEFYHCRAQHIHGVSTVSRVTNTRRDPSLLAPAWSPMMWGMSKRDGKSYFKVFAIEDKTVILAMPSRKPHPKSIPERGKIDEDGVWYWFIEGHDDLENYKQEVRHLIFGTLANAINVKRALRRQVEEKLAGLTQQVEALKEQLDRIEQKIDSRMEGSR